jgi:hypothetical protein
LQGVNGRSVTRFDEQTTTVDIGVWKPIVRASIVLQAELKAGGSTNKRSVFFGIMINFNQW